jgi:hypothetical protein
MRTFGTPQSVHAVDIYLSFLSKKYFVSITRRWLVLLVWWAPIHVPGGLLSILHIGELAITIDPQAMDGDGQHAAKACHCSRFI